MKTIFRAGVLSLAIAAGGASAHGDEPHGDAPHPAAATPDTGPRFEAKTNLFEVVGRLEAGSLTLWVSRFATGEPVDRAAVEVEIDTLKATASYRADRGDYVVQDAAFVAALAKPGQHPLVLTVTAGDDADLLDATMAIASPDTPAATGAAPESRIGMASAAVLALATVVGLGVLWRQRRRATREISA